MGRGLCQCGPGDIRPRRGTVCGRCDRYVIGPPRPSDTAFQVHQTPQRPAGRRRARSVAGHQPPPPYDVDDPRAIDRAGELRAREISARDRSAADAAGERRSRAELDRRERVGFGIGALARLYAPLISKVKADKRRRARRARRKPRTA